MKIIVTNVAPDAASVLKINHHPNNRGAVHPDAPPPAPKAPVVRTPFAQHTLADGTTVAPSWTPEHVDANLATGAWNRSWDDTVAHLNPAGDPTERRQHNQAEDQAPDRLTRVLFQDGKKIVSRDEDTLPAKPQSVLFATQGGSRAPRRKIVGAIKTLTVFVVALLASHASAQVLMQHRIQTADSNDQRYVKQSAVTSYAGLVAAITACGSAPCSVQVGGAVVLSTNLTIPASVTLSFTGGQIQPAAGVTVTVQGLVADTLSQIFGGGGHIVIAQGNARPEWFGAVGDGVTDDTSALNSALAALTSGNLVLRKGTTYVTSATLTITTPNTGVEGANQGFGYASNAGSSVIKCTSPTATILDLHGPSNGNYIQWNTLKNFAVQRSVLPTGSAIGISLNHVAGIHMDGVNSADSITGFYLHDAPNYATGIIENSQATWGDLSVTAYTSGMTLYGWYVDSADGFAMNSQTLFNAAASTNGGAGITSALTYGLYIKGTSINDFETDWFFAYRTTVGIHVECVAPAMSCSDNHFVNSIIDSFGVNGMEITTLDDGKMGSVDVDGGWFGSAVAPNTGVAATSGKAFYIFNTTGAVTIEHAQITDQVAGTYGVYASNDYKLSLIGNNFLDMTAPIYLSAVQNSIINGNIVHNSKAASAGTGIALVNSTGDVITANEISGYNYIGISADSNSKTGNIITANRIDPTHTMTAALSGVGQPQMTQTVTLTGSPLCSAAAGVGNTCFFTVNWFQAFPDTNYTFACYGATIVGAGVVQGEGMKTTTSVPAALINLSSSAASITKAYCVGSE